jgi:hypothetical protein
MFPTEANVKKAEKHTLNDEMDDYYNEYNTILHTEEIKNSIKKKN